MSSTNALVDESNIARSLNIRLDLLLYQYFVYASSEALVSLCMCTDSPEPSLLDNLISNNISCAGSNIDVNKTLPKLMD